MSAPLVRAVGLAKRFVRRGALWRPPESVEAVRGVDLEIAPGEVVGLVGESGSGKSTVGRILMRLIEPDAGTIEFDGESLLDLRGAALRKRRRGFQMVFQDPYGSLNPRLSVGRTIAEPLEVHGLCTRADRRDKVGELMRRVGLDPATMDRYPHEFSGGQRQRIGIARAIACGPRFIVADEPVSALDPPVQAQIVNLLLELQASLGLAYLFIAHDLSLVRHVCERVYVMHRGRIVESAPTARLFERAEHPYTRSLLAAIPQLVPGARRESAPYRPEPGEERAELVEVAPGHRVAKTPVT